ncbi:hypothetical protein HHK36_006773 [Tetracentron sinense]|uniref:Bet v I/Major latex protein domain-containing protein n=1 Tax=Tetracentron sinense TaxID=13715 RepID=A0A834Y9E1_TETSI|nr:hypothetical protein HHK36_032266 [Tetracentron sinense]KAF8407640.1 hypothetical protein HHK36_006773 [Tetracentron sinense]
MATIDKIEVQIKSPADKFYGIFRNNIGHLTEVFPDHYKSMEVIEGEGNGLGSARLWNFHLETPMVFKERIIAIDDENRSITFSALEGDINTDYCTFNPTVQVTPQGDGSLVKWFIEFEKTNEDVRHPNHFLDFFEKVTKEMDAYLLKT